MVFNLDASLATSHEHKSWIMYFSAYRLWVVCWQNQSYCVAELLPGLASAWLMLPSMKNKVKFNCLQHLITIISQYHWSKAILQSVICKSVSWAKKWIFYVMWYVDIHSYYCIQKCMGHSQNPFTVCVVLHVICLICVLMWWQGELWRRKGEGKSWPIYSLMSWMYTLVRPLKFG